MKIFCLAFSLSLILVFFTVAAHAQEEQEDAAKKYNVAFPVAELGNCGNLAECRSFCEDPLNQNTCVAFAKSHGFYKEQELTSKKDEILNAAKKELGCDSESSCMVYCGDQANFDKCDSFAKKKGLSGGRIEDTTKGRILEKAKEVLGCNSSQACASFCSEEQNRQKCSEFAKEVGLKGGEHRVGPGGCTSEDTCKAFCSDPQNFQICRGFIQSSGGQFTGPGGCNSEQSCRAYCRDHEDECRSLGGSGSPPPGYNPQEMCSRTPNCNWEENTCKCGFYGKPGEAGERAEEYVKFCRENPDKCRPGQTGGFNSDKERKDFEDYCRQNPDRCRQPSSSGGVSNTDSRNPYNDPPAVCSRSGTGCYWTGSACKCPAAPTSSGYPGSGISGGYSGGSHEDPATACRRGGGCTWTGTACQCPTTPVNTTNTTSNTASSNAPSGMSRDFQEAGCRSCGGTCSWNGDFCNCQCSNSGSGGSSTSAPAQVPAQTSVPQPQEAQQSTPAPSSEVHGVSVTRSILDQILDFFR